MSLRGRNGNHQKCAGHPNAPPYHLPTGQDCITSLLHVDPCMLSEAILEAQQQYFLLHRSECPTNAWSKITNLTHNFIFKTESIMKIFKTESILMKFSTQFSCAEHQSFSNLSFFCSTYSYILCIFPQNCYF